MAGYKTKYQVRSIPSECLPLKLVQDFLGVSVRNQKELILIGIQTIRFEKEKKLAVDQRIS